MLAIPTRALAEPAISRPLVRRYRGRHKGHGFAAKGVVGREQRLGAARLVDLQCWFAFGGGWRFSFT
jgi:hypothetical protein